jgi:hypothetical protein
VFVYISLLLSISTRQIINLLAFTAYNESVRLDGIAIVLGKFIPVLHILELECHLFFLLV